MKAGHGLLAAAVGLFLVVLSAARGRRRPAGRARRTIPPYLPAPPPPTTSDRRPAARCHKESFDQWQRSLHIRMTKPIAEATIVGDFSGAQAGRIMAVRSSSARADGKPFMRVAFGTAKPETFRVDYTLGSKRYQGYLSTLADGRMYVLPAFWHVESRRWVDWKEITPIPDGAHDLRQIWNTNCFNCHATNLAQGFDVTTKSYTSTWTEMGIGCEACHGPGRPHVELMEAWEKDPAAKPAYDNSAKNRELSGPLKIFSPRSGDAAADLRHLRLLSRQQAERVRRLPRRRSLRGLRAAVSHQRADSRQRFPRRVLAGRSSQPVQPPAGADAERMLQGRPGRVHELPRGARIAQSVLAEGQYHAGPHWRSAVRAVPRTRCDGCDGCDRCDGCAVRRCDASRCRSRRGCRDPITSVVGRGRSSSTRFTRPRRRAAAASAVT